MQQTQTYKLDLIEKTDPFSPDALNANTRKVEDVLTAQAKKTDAALGAERAAREGADAALSDRITVLEAKKLAYGWYAGNNGTQQFQVGFTPKLVMVCGSYDGMSPSSIVIAGLEVSPISMRIVEGGFEVFQGRPGIGYPNQHPATYIYLALA